MIFEVKILPLLIGMVFNMVLGMLWYSKVLFMVPWMKESGVTKEDLENPNDKMGKVYFLTAIFALATSYVVGFIINNMSITSVLNAILVAVIVWVGLNLPMVIKNWGFENRSIKLGLINHSYELVVYIVVSILFVLM